MHACFLVYYKCFSTVLVLMSAWFPFRFFRLFSPSLLVAICFKVSLISVVLVLLVLVRFVLCTMAWSWWKHLMIQGVHHFSMIVGKWRSWCCRWFLRFQFLVFCVFSRGQFLWGAFFEGTSFLFFVNNVKQCSFFDMVNMYALEAQLL